ncbi:hypothetical protein JCM17960_19910 [Magnetospira thiophila]
MTNNEFFYMEDGVKKDALLHEEMLDNPEADRAGSEWAIEDAVARGVLREVAVQMFGIRDLNKDET